MARSRKNPPLFIPTLDPADLPKDRRAAGLTQRALANKAKVPVSIISRFERGLIPNLDPLTSCALCLAICCCPVIRERK